eukprot:NP_491111.2 Uncharacterized protein CELE_K09H9.1 [Caenorhabditis elegans]
MERNNFLFFVEIGLSEDRSLASLNSIFEEISSNSQPSHHHTNDSITLPYDATIQKIAEKEKNLSKLLKELSIVDSSLEEEKASFEKTQSALLKEKGKIEKDKLMLREEAQKQASMNAEMTTIVDSVFNNEAIVSRVLEKTSKNSISNLDLRVQLDCLGFGAISPIARFDVLPSTQPQSMYILEEVQINVQFAKTLIDELDKDESLFDNFIANSQRIFPTKRVTVEFPMKYIQLSIGNLEKLIKKCMKMVSKEPQRNTTTIFRMHLQDANFSQSVNRVFNIILCDEIPEIFHSSENCKSDDTSDCWHLETIQPIPEQKANQFYGDDTILTGKCFCLKNLRLNSCINYQLLFEKQFLIQFFKEKTGFMRHFYDLVS